MALSRAEVDARIEEARAKRAAQTSTPKRSGWDGAKEGLKKAASATKAGLKEIKKHQGKGKGGGMMKGLDRMMNTDYMGSPRRRSRPKPKRKVSKKRQARRPRIIIY